MKMKFQFNDGGRAAAGYKGKAGDCVVRAVAIITGRPYKDIAEEINAIGQTERYSKRKTKSKSNSKEGVYKATVRRYLTRKLGMTWTPTMQIGSGCRVHLCAEELPPGRLLVSVSHHLVAVIDGVIHDNHDSSRGGTRCVYGYYSF